MLCWGGRRRGGVCRGGGERGGGGGLWGGGMGMEGWRVQTRRGWRKKKGGVGRGIGGREGSGGGGGRFNGLGRSLMWSYRPLLNHSPINSLLLWDSLYVGLNVLH